MKKLNKFEISKAGNSRHFNKPYLRSYSRILKSGKEINLSYEEYLKFTETKNCHYCGNLINWVKHGKNANAYNLDRKDSNKGYSTENCVVCCWKCNNKKRTLTYEEMLKISIYNPINIDDTREDFMFQNNLWED